MNSLKQDVARMQELIAGAFQQAGGLAVLAGSGQPDTERLQKTLEQTAAQLERAALELRRLCETHSPGAGGYGVRPAAPVMEASGLVETFGYGWLHIQLNTLLPHCRFQTPEWLTDTIRRLLDEYESGGSELPWSDTFEEAFPPADDSGCSFHPRSQSCTGVLPFHPPVPVPPYCQCQESSQSLSLPSP